MIVSATEPNTPLNYFSQAYGPAAIPTMHLNWALTTLSLSVCFVIAALLLIASLRRRCEQESEDHHIGERKGLRWIYIGTGLSTLILLVFTVYMLVVLNGLAHPPQEPALTITVTAYDWWWKIDYENSDPTRHFITANEIHIPVGQPVLVELKSADVIHAFWVPELAGKTQTIPGLTNQQWFQTDKPGRYRGACTQYCGAQHAHMDFEIVAESAEDFRKWQENQRRPAFNTTDKDVVEGRKLFTDRCGGCHAVRGTQAAGTHAPDLTHLFSRRQIAAGLMDTNTENIMQWTLHAQELKPESRMPDMELSASEQSRLTAFLATLY